MQTRGRFSKDEARLDNIETHYNNMSATMKSLEVQVGQLANKLKNQQKGKFPSNIEQNPRDHCKAITIKSRKEVVSSGQKEKKGKEVDVEVEVEQKAEEVKPAETSKPRGISFPDNPLIISPPLPFPQRFQKKKLYSQFFKFLEIFKKIHITIPFANALEQMPNYAKFIKEVMAKKRRLEDYETIKLMGSVVPYCKGNYHRKLKIPVASRYRALLETPLLTRLYVILEQVST